MSDAYAVELSDDLLQDLTTVDKGAHHVRWDITLHHPNTPNDSSDTLALTAVATAEDSNGARIDNPKIKSYSRHALNAVFDQLNQYLKFPYINVTMQLLPQYVFTIDTSIDKPGLRYELSFLSQNVITPYQISSWFNYGFEPYQWYSNQHLDLRLRMYVYPTGANTEPMVTPTEHEDVAPVPATIIGSPVEVDLTNYDQIVDQANSSKAPLQERFRNILAAVTNNPELQKLRGASTQLGTTQTTVPSTVTDDSDKQRRTEAMRQTTELLRAQLSAAQAAKDKRTDNDDNTSVDEPIVSSVEPVEFDPDVTDSE